ncbi:MULTISPECIES: hypothetical protein [Paenibacillus]|uniref:hypothetical protein n=1 Tax=Paenibacillus TaxID=44249 RepID=UPI001BCB24E0|nr:hypothetical protein [Paenibacillus dendritiformis]
MNAAVLVVRMKHWLRQQQSSLPAAAILFLNVAPGPSEHQEQSSCRHWPIAEVDLLVSGCEARPPTNGLEKLKVAIPVSPDPGRHRRLQLVTRAIKQLLFSPAPSPAGRNRPDEALAPPAAEQPPSCSN